MLFACILAHTLWHTICIRNQLMESNKRARILRPQSNRRRTTTTTTTATTNRNRERDCNGMEAWWGGGWNVIDTGRRETGLPTSTMRLLVTVLMTLPARIPRIQSTTPREGDAGSKATTRRQLLLQLQLQSLPLALALQLQLPLQLASGTCNWLWAVGTANWRATCN